MDELLDAIVTAVPSRYRYEVIKKCVQTTLSRSAVDKEQVSAMMQQLVSLGVVSQDQAVEGFYRVLWVLSGLRLDGPNACDLVARFIVRAMADGVLPRNFVDSIPDAVLLHKDVEVCVPVRVPPRAHRGVLTSTCSQLDEQISW